MTWYAVGAAAVSLVGSAVASNQSSKASTKATKDALAASQSGTTQSLDFLRQQAAIARGDESPFTTGGTNAFNQYLTQLGIAPGTSTPANTGGGSYGSQLVPLNGITTTGIHTAQAKGGKSGLAGALPNFVGSLNPITGGQSVATELGMGSKSGGHGTTGAGSPSLFYDPGSHTVVDAQGNLVSSVPQSGVIPGLVSGFNNQVSIDANGNLTSMGSGGSNPLNIQLTPLTDAQKAAYGTSANPTGAATPSTDPANRYGAYFASPGYNFLYDETMRSAKASGAARGGLYSGAMLKELQDRAQGVASQDYGNYMTRLAGAAQIGQAAASGTAANATNLGTQGANIITQGADNSANAALVGGASRASSINSANSTFQSTLGALANYYGRTQTVKP